MLTANINDGEKREFFIPAIYSPSLWENKIPVKRTYTYEDYTRLPEGAPYQLIGGELIMTPSPMPYHQELSRELGFKLFSFVKENDLGHVYYAPEVSQKNIMPPCAVVRPQENLWRIYVVLGKVYQNSHPLQLEQSIFGHRKRQNGCDLLQRAAGLAFF